MACLDGLVLVNGVKWKYVSCAVLNELTVSGDCMCIGSWFQAVILTLLLILCVKQERKEALMRKSAERYARLELQRPVKRNIPSRAFGGERRGTGFVTHS